MRAMALGLLAAVLWELSGMEVPPRLTRSGIAFDGGTLGVFTLSYPKFKANGSSAEPDVKLEGSRAVLTYRSGAAPVVELKLDGARLFVSATAVSAGSLIWDMLLPIRFAGWAEWSFGTGGKSGILPRLKPSRPHLAQLSAAGFRLADPRSGESVAITLNRPEFWQLQDNREWKWKIFQLSLFTALVSGERTAITLEFSTGRPKEVPVLVDRFGQPSRLDFPGKVHNEAELKADVAADRVYYDSLKPPVTAAWGGLSGSCQQFGLRRTGFFRLDRIGGREILVTPEGDVFFQLGVCTVNPCDDYTLVRGREQIYAWLPEYDGQYRSAFRDRWAMDFSFYLANRIRKTGRPFELNEWKSEQILRLRKWGFNSEGAFTVHTPVNGVAKFGRTPVLGLIPGIVGDVFDPFDANHRRMLDQKFSEIARFKDDPTIIGYFIANEQPYQKIVRIVPGLNGSSAVKRELVNMLRRKYRTIDRFSAAWQVASVDFTGLNDLALPVQTTEARRDMQEFAGIFFESYFGLIARTFRRFDPNHLLLGARFTPDAIQVEEAVKACGKYCDVFSINYYTDEVSVEFLERVHQLAGRPLLLSEWSYGTSEQGLAGGTNDVSDQTERGHAYRRYVESAVALPYVIGSQWFSYIDQALTGRFFEHYNGECLNIGLLNVADRPFKLFLAEVVKTNYRIYELMLDHQ